MVPYSSRNQWDRGRGAFSLPLSDNVNALILTANTPSFIDVPGDARYVSFTASDDFWMRHYGEGDPADFQEVASDITDGTAPEFNPTVRQLTGDVVKLGFLSDQAGAVVSVSFYGGGRG